ncbi:MAG: hypothetical protein ACMUJM_21690 [bacterium]
MKNFIKLTVAGTLLFISMYFLFQNRWIYEKGYPIIFYKSKSRIIGFEEVKLAIQFVFMFFLGAFLTAFCYIFKTSKFKKQLKQNQKTITQMEDELKSLRNLPLTENQSE